jgi:hypothetical protein
MSPVIYTYFQIYLEFFSTESEREGPHVHILSIDEKRGVKVLFDITMKDIPEKWVKIGGKANLRPKEKKLAEEIVNDEKANIIKKWVDFRLGKKVKRVSITKRIK